MPLLVARPALCTNRNHAVHIPSHHAMGSDAMQSRFLAGESLSARAGKNPIGAIQGQERNRPGHSGGNGEPHADAVRTNRSSRISIPCRIWSETPELPCNGLNFIEPSESGIRSGAIIPVSGHALHRGPGTARRHDWSQPPDRHDTPEVSARPCTRRAPQTATGWKRTVSCARRPISWQPECREEPPPNAPSWPVPEISSELTAGSATAPGPPGAGPARPPD